MEQTKTLSAEQLFWGHTGLEYNWLSGGNSQYASKVEQLCASVGTPDSSDQKSFLISAPYEDKLIWARCSKGSPDKSGRPTLFFHVFVVNAAEVERLGINAFDAMESNCFSNSVDFTSNVELRVNSRYVPKTSSSNLCVIDNRVIISNQPEPDAVFQRVQSQVNQIAWATYSYRFMDQMEWSVLSDKASMPETVHKKTASVNTSDHNEDASVQHVKSESSPSAIMKYLFIGSLVLNAVLLLGYFIVPRTGSTNMNSVEPLPEFPKESRFTDDEWKNAKEQMCLKNVFVNRNEKANAEKIDEYVKYVNKNVIKERK